LRRDIRRIEWTFDPLETKNAHFNINRLGAISRAYIPNFYGITTSPLHRGLPTDRLLVEWHLDSPRVIAAIQDLTPDPKMCPAHVHLPGDEKGVSGTVGELIEIQTGLRNSLTEWFAKSYAILGVRFTRMGVDYCLGPYSDF